MKFRVFKQVPRIIYGFNSSKRINELIPDNFKNGLVIVDSAVAKRFRNLKIPDKNFSILEFDATISEPFTWQVDEIVKKYKNKNNFDFIIGIGGGSTMDLAKGISICLNNDESASELQGWDLVKKNAVFKIGIPTIFGSGSEASRTAVFNNGKKKQGINSDFSMFDGIILDPNLSHSLSTATHFYTAMDCYIHCVESISGTMINQLSKGYASKALEYCENYFDSKHNNEELICVGSYYGGVSIVNSEVGICHALSYGLSIEFGFRHGLANCVVFQHLEDFYGDFVRKFNRWVNHYKIEIPSGITKNIDKNKIDKMIDQTLLMERPLINAFGQDWKNKIDRNTIKDIYLRL